MKRAKWYSTGHAHGRPEARDDDDRRRRLPSRTIRAAGPDMICGARRCSRDLRSLTSGGRRISPTPPNERCTWQGANVAAAPPLHFIDALQVSLGIDFCRNLSMTDPNTQLHDRVSSLERQLRRASALATLFCVGAVCLVTTAFLRAPKTPDVIRARQLIIEDQAGRDRVLLGAPIRDNFKRISPATGMVIRDSLGNERFGLSLNAQGTVALGLDAPKCTSNPCNPERINLI